MHITLPREIYCDCGRVRAESELQKLLTGASKLNREVHNYCRQQGLHVVLQELHSVIGWCGANICRLRMATLDLQYQKQKPPDPK